MAYRIRHFSIEKSPLDLDELKSVLTKNTRMRITAINECGWNKCLITTVRGNEICEIERVGIEDEIFFIDVDEFTNELQDSKPESASRWAMRELKNVKNIYVIEYRNYSFATKYEIIPGNILHRIRILNEYKGFSQADHEGYTNGEGYHIIWKFSEKVRGKWNMAILNSDEKWMNFTMDLGNRDHRSAFIAGNIPETIVLSNK